MTRVLLVRHGETDWNREGRWQGQAGPGLNETGLWQARAVAERLASTGIDALYSSDLERALQTAAALTSRLGLEPLVDPDLREVDVGDWSGLTREQVLEQDPRGYARWRRGLSGWHGGETYAQMHARSVAALGRILIAHERQSVAVVAHGGPIRALVSHVVGLPAEERQRLATGRNCSLTVLEHSEERLVLVTFNEEHHLVPSVTTP